METNLIREANFAGVAGPDWPGTPTKSTTISFRADILPRIPGADQQQGAGGQTTVICEKWWKDGGLHRLDGPAVIERDPATDTVICEEWWSDGTLHRVDGPAVIERDPATGIVTREDWWNDGSLHRTDGPAIIERDPATGIVTCEEWWREGDEIAPPAAEPVPQAGDTAHDDIAAMVRAITGLVTGPPNLIGFDFADLRVALFEQGCAVFAQGEAEGPDRARRAVDAAVADLKRQLRSLWKRRAGTGRCTVLIGNPAFSL